MRGAGARGIRARGVSSPPDRVRVEVAMVVDGQSWVNPRDAARAVGPDGTPARSRRAPHYADVPDAQRDDWRWQLSNRVNDLAEFAEILEFTAEEREGLGAPDRFRVDITP